MPRRKIILSPHAERKTTQRAISLRKVRQVLSGPDKIRTSHSGRQIAEGFFGKLKIRVVYIEEHGIPMMITAH